MRLSKYRPCFLYEPVGVNIIGGIPHRVWKLSLFRVALVLLAGAAVLALVLVHGGAW